MAMQIRATLVAMTIVGLSACGGGGTAQLDNSSRIIPPDPATVGILLTDAHGTRWDQAFAAITSIELLGDDYHATIFTGSETVDLLSLPDYFELFTVADDVFPGDFSKIRLQVEMLELVDLDDMGMELERVVTKLVGNGKIDIKTHGPIAISGGDTLFIEIDFDMNKAFKTTETSNGEVILRPVVFARIVTEGRSNRLTRVFGVVESISDADQSLVLCQTGLAANHDDDDEEEEDSRCIFVLADDLTGVFNVDGLPVTFADVMAGDELTAVGFLRHEDEDDEDGSEDEVAESEAGPDAEDEHELDGHGVDDDFFLEAVVLEIGANFDRFAGTVQTEVAGDAFDFALATGQGFASDTVISTQLFASTRVFSRDGTEADLLSIVPDVHGVVDGVIVLGGEGAGDLLRAALIVLDLAVDVSADLLQGEILSVAPADGFLQLLVGDMDRCVDARSADIFLISDDDGFESEPGDLGDLLSGMRADVYGEEGIDGCFIASDILASTSSS